MSDKTKFDYWFMERNGLWSEYVQEAREQGFEKASPLARLIYSCEIGSGIDQHASEDLKAVSATIAALRERLQRLEAVYLAAHEMMGEIGSQWDFADAHDDHVLETDLSCGVMKQLAAALEGAK